MLEVKTTVNLTSIWYLSGEKEEFAKKYAEEKKISVYEAVKEIYFSNAHIDTNSYRDSDESYLSNEELVSVIEKND